MSVWTLARSAQSGALSLGRTRDDIITAFGEPTDVSDDILKYDAIEFPEPNE